MSDIFNAGELIKIAINIERSAITFFDIMARTTDSDTARDIFEQFVGMEREHLSLLQDILTQLNSTSKSGTLTSENSDYIRALIEDDVFSSDKAMDEAVAQSDSDLKALEIGTRAEKDSILFYQAVRDVLPNTAAVSLDKILDDEKTHLRQLSEIKNKLDISE
jgi:rubrerythrin